MLKVKIPAVDLKPGDVIEYEGKRLTVSTGERDQGGLYVMSIAGGYPNVYFSAAFEATVVGPVRAHATRVAEVLAAFDTAIIKEVIALFCVICGERECKGHYEGLPVDELDEIEGQDA